MKEILNRLITTFKKYYASILLFMLATTIFMFIIHDTAQGVYVYTKQIKLFLSLINGAFMAILVPNIIEKIKNKTNLYNLVYLLVSFTIAFVYFYILKDMNGSAGLRYFTYNFALIISLFAIPFIGTRHDSDYYSYKSIVSLAITMISAFLLIGGSQFILYSVSLLFEINFELDIYLNTIFFILGFLMPTLFFFLLPNMEIEKQAYPVYINKILFYIVLPILSIYTVILYAYFIRILILFNMPSNMLGNLIIYYSLVSVIVLYFTNKMHSINNFILKFIRIYPYTLILPMIMMLITFLIRINQYGFTEIRYYGIICFIFVIASIFFVRRTKSVKYIPITLSILLLVSIFGPLSAANVSKMSQQNRLEKILVKNKMLKDNKIIPNDNISSEDKNEIYSILVYYENMYNLNDINYLSDTFTTRDINTVFGFTDY